MTNLDNLLSNENLNHREVSIQIGSSENWFNDAFNNNEDIRLSSLVKVLSVIPNKMGVPLETLFDSKILEISSMMSNLISEDESYIEEFILAEKTLYIDIIGDWAAMINNNKLNISEENTAKQIRDIISTH